MIKITYFVHGTTTDNERGIATGQSPGKLSSLGIRQAKELGKLVYKKHFDAVFCSDLKRAIVSAKLAFGQYTIILDKRLREADYGDFTEMPIKKFKKNLDKYVDKPFPNGESYKNVEKRISDFLECQEPPVIDGWHKLFSVS